MKAMGCFVCFNVLFLLSKKKAVHRKQAMGLPCRATAEEDTMISSSAAFNSLHLLLHDPTLFKFVKFVSHVAPSSRFDIAVEFLTDLTLEEIQCGSE
jgi:hypothetical protein